MNTRGGEGIFLSLVGFCHDLFYIYTFPLYPLAPFLAIQIGLIIQCGSSCLSLMQLLWRQHTAVFCTLTSTQGSTPRFMYIFCSGLLEVCIIYGNRKVEWTSDTKNPSSVCLWMADFNLSSCFKHLRNHRHTNTSLHTFTSSHPHTNRNTHTQSHNRCLVSGVLYL